MHIKTVKSTKIKCLFLINESSFMKRKKGKQTMSNLASSQKPSRGCFNPNYRSLFLELCRTCASPSLERHSASAGMKRTLGWVTHFPWGSGQVHFTDFWPSSCTNYGMKRCYLWLVYEYLVVMGQKNPPCVTHLLQHMRHDTKKSRVLACQQAAAKIQRSCQCMSA